MASPAAAAVSAAFDRDVFRKSMLMRSMNLQTSARAAILPTNEAILNSHRVESRAMTDRYALVPRLPHFPDPF